MRIKINETENTQQILFNGDRQQSPSTKFVQITMTIGIRIKSQTIKQLIINDN